jgi:hypothetical protein
MINALQLRTLIIEPALQMLGLHSEAAVHLLLGTAAVESAMGHYIAQVNGPAQGIFQMEPATYRDLWANYIAFHPEIENKLRDDFRGRATNPSQMVYDLRYAAAMCRIHYLRIREPLPDAHDIEGMAQYWKRYYNTALGKGTPEKFIRAFEKYVMPEGA